MDLVRWQDDFLIPEQGLDRLQREINRLFDFPRSVESRGLFDRTVSPAVDVVETHDAFVVNVDLPGIDAKEIDISVAGNVLTLKGKRKAVSHRGEVYRKETWEGIFQRTLSLPATVDPDRVSGVFKDGVLEVTIGKREEARPRRIAVKAG
jgi:HSP20 family protein